MATLVDEPILEDVEEESEEDNGDKHINAGDTKEPGVLKL